MNTSTRFNQINLDHEQRMIAMFTRFVSEWQERVAENKAKGYIGAVKYDQRTLRSYRMKLQWANQRASHYAAELRKD